MAGRDERSTVGDWFGSEQSIGRTRGTVFKWACLGATVLALGLMLVFLVYVFNDAIQPLTADVGWLLSFLVPLLVTVLGYAGYAYRRSPSAGRVAYTALGVPLVTAMFAGGIWIIFEHILTAHEWLALVVAVGLAAAIVEGHARVRTNVFFERLAVVVVVPLLTIVGIPAIDIDYPVRTPLLGQELFTISLSTPELLPSVRELILSIPMLPIASITFLVTFTLPIAAAMGWYIYGARESARDASITAALIGVLGAAGIVLGPALGVGPITWIVCAPIVAGSSGLYAERVIRQGRGRVGLTFPLAIAASIGIGLALVSAFGFNGPEAWIDWSFLTRAHDTTASEAGIYPTLVGSILMLLVIVVSAFPVGVGAAVYLEEYAPTQGRMSRVVELIEVNIANLAGVPSVVYGVLGLTIFIRTIGMGPGTALVGGLTVGLLILPIIIISAQEAVRSVPDSRRNAAYGMGATKWQTVRGVILPEAAPGILTGTILALGRAIGETAPLIMILMPAVVRTSPSSFMTRTGVMSRQIYTWSKQIDPSFRYGVLAAGVVTLLAVLLTMNATAIVLRNRYQRDS